ncbi:MAG: hypothetical protein ABR969_00840 [Sedimentisphaerales bacterium]|jgi:hypothetical protein
MEMLITKWLSQAAAEMKAEAKNGSPTFRVLRELNNKLNSRLDISGSSEEKCFAYFLSLFIDDIFNNLAGDFPYAEEVITEKNSFLNQLAIGIEKLSKEDYNAGGGGWTTLSQIVDSYFTLLEKIEKILAKRKDIV